jgi:hypothetical protein
MEEISHYQRYKFTIIENARRWMTIPGNRARHNINQRNWARKKAAERKLEKEQLANLPV